MSSTIQVLDPVAPPSSASAHQSVGAIASLRGATVGFIDNSKPNFALLADDLERLLVTRYGVARVLRHQKPNASIGAQQEVIAALARDCDVVICGSGD